MMVEIGGSSYQLLVTWAVQSWYTLCILCRERVWWSTDDSWSFIIIQMTVSTGYISTTRKFSHHFPVCITGQSTRPTVWLCIFLISMQARRPLLRFPSNLKFQLPTGQACDASQVASGICWRKSTWNLSQYRPCLSWPLKTPSCPTVGTQASWLQQSVKDEPGQIPGEGLFVTSRTLLLKSSDTVGDFPTLRNLRVA